MRHLFMLRHRTIVTAALCAIIAVAALRLGAESPRFFADIAGEKGISSVYVGKALLGRALAGEGGKLDALQQFGVDEASLRNVEAVEVLHANTPDAIVKIRNKLKQLLTGNSFDVISEMTNEGSRVAVYGRTDPASPETVNCFLLVTDRTEDASFSVVTVWGRMQLH